MPEVDIFATLDEVNFAPSSVLEEIIQNVKTILTTVKYSVPLDRNFGIMADALDAPLPVAKAKITADIVSAIKQYEPRAEITQIIFSGDGADGILKPRVRIRANV